MFMATHTVLDTRRPHEIVAEGRPLRDPQVRTGDHSSIKTPRSPEGTAAQAARCHKCHSPTCGGGCPINRDIPRINAAIAKGDNELAFERIGRDPFALFTEQVCPQGKLCESTCVQEITGHKAVTIGDNLLSVALWAFENGKYQPPHPAQERDERVTIVGSGPGGLAAAWALRQQGFKVTVIESQDEAGGQLIYGIPNFKLDKKYPHFVVDLLREAGVEFKLNCEVVGENPENDPGKITFAEVMKQSDQVILATGLYEPRGLNVPGADLPQIQPAYEYLTTSTQQFILGKQPAQFADGTLNAKGKRVVVMGGGDTAMDVVRTAIRQGAKSVTLVYRGDADRMPAYIKELDAAKAEGVAFVYEGSPKEIVAIPDTNSVKVVFNKTALVEGRLQETGKTFNRRADLVVPAFGFDVRSLGISVLENGRVALAPSLDSRRLNYATPTDKVWAIGDIVQGNALVVHAIRDGRAAAEQIAARYPLPSLEPRQIVVNKLRQRLADAALAELTPGQAS
jgi:glutamate synthase (NADPH/NADH) small chain